MSLSRWTPAFIAALAIGSGAAMVTVGASEPDRSVLEVASAASGTVDLLSGAPDAIGFPSGSRGPAR